jgi:hypothetical protein
MYKVNYTFRQNNITQMGSFEVSDCSFNENEFFTIVDFCGEKSLSILQLSKAPEVYGKTIYLNVKEFDFPIERDCIDFEVIANRNGNDETVRRYEEAFDLLSAFRQKGLNHV